MKKLCLLALLLPMLAGVAMAQNYHQPDELFKILENSKISYVLEEATSAIPAENFDENLVPAGMYLEKNQDGQISLANYDTQLSAIPKVVEAMRKGDTAFAANDMTTARQYYMTMLEAFPDNSVVLTYIGQTFEHEKNHDEAIQWLSKAVKNNPIDYMAHWFLADNYAVKNEIELAMKHITTAHLLNRNNPRILASLKNIYAMNGTPYDDWEFRPACMVDTTAEGKPRIIIDKNKMEWSMYAICKALWRFEPGYPETVRNNSDEPDIIIAEKEALFSLAVGSANANGEEPVADASINVLTQTIHDRTFENFLYYDVLLRRYPNIALLIQEENRQAFAEYIMKYHTKK